MKWTNILLLVLLGAIWGSSFLFLRIVTPVVGATLTMSIRIVFAAGVMLILFGYLKQLPDYKVYWKQYFILGVLNLVLPFTLISYSISNLNASVGAILNATTPLFTMIISSWWLKEKMSFKKIVGIMVGLAGLIILVGWIPFDLTGKVIISVVSSLLASFSYGVGAVYTKVYLRNAQPLKTATGQMSAAALLVVPLMYNPASMEAFNITILIVVLILAVFCTALAYGLYFQLITNIGSTNTSLVTLLVPVFSLLWGKIFLDEPLTPAIVIGLALILGSLKLVLSPAK